MSNEVEINVKSNDKTNFDKIGRDAKGRFAKAGDDAGAAFGKSASRGMGKGGEDGAKSFGSTVKKWFDGSGSKLFGKGGEDSLKSFGSTAKKWFAGDGTKLFGKGGQVTGDSFKNGLGGILKAPVIGPMFTAALAGAAAVAAPAAGAVAASGIVLGFGAGIAGLGVLFASKSKPVRDTWSKTTKEMGQDMTQLSRPFESTLTSMAGFAQRTFGKFVPSLQAAFKEMAPVVTKFGDQVSRGLERLAPAVRPLSEAFNAVLGSTGPALQSALGSVSQGLTDLSISVKKNPDGLADLVDNTGKLTQNLLGLVGSLNNANGEIERLTGGTSAVDLLFGRANSKVGEFVGWVKNGIDPLSGLKNGLDLVAGSADKTTTSVGLSGNAMKMWTQGLDTNQLKAMGITVAGVGDNAAAAAPKVESLSDKFNRQKGKTDALIQSLFQLQNGYLGLSNAQISYQSAVDAATQSVKDNGKNLDITTAKGQANQSALNSLAQATNGQTESMIRNNKGLVAAYGSAAKARENFVALAIQMGATKPQAEAMASSMIAIPNVTREARLKANKADLDSKLAAARKALGDKNLTKERKAQLNAEIKKLVSQVNAAQAKIDALHGKTVTNNVVTKYTSVGSRSSGSGVGGGHEIDGKSAGGPVLSRRIPHMAAGGRPPLKLSSRQFVAGEYGEELVEVDGTGNVRVTPTGNTKRRLNPSGFKPGAGGRYQQPSPAGMRDGHLILDTAGSGLDQLLIKVLQRSIKSRGGNVQLVLGGRAL